MIPPVSLPVVSYRASVSIHKFEGHGIGENLLLEPIIGIRVELFPFETVHKEPPSVGQPSECLVHSKTVNSSSRCHHFIQRYHVRIRLRQNYVNSISAASMQFRSGCISRVNSCAPRATTTLKLFRIFFQTMLDISSTHINPG
jgi:hypothetical protein